MSVSSNIKKTLKARIQALDTVQVVYGYRETNIKGWPAVIIIANDMDGEFTSNTENRRKYEYQVLVMYDLGQKVAGLQDYDSLPKNEQAEEFISDVVDQIIDDIDTNFELTGNTDVLYCEAADARWGFVEHSGGIAKACNIVIRVVSDFNVNS